MEINGIAHVILTVSNFEKCYPFYEKLLPFLGMKPVINNDQMFYCVGARTAVGIMPCAEEHRGALFEQQRIGLHHVCLRARDQASVDEAHRFLQSIGAKIVHAPETGPWAPGYYSVLFEDPDGLRLEINYVPGKGLLA